LKHQFNALLPSLQTHKDKIKQLAAMNNELAMYMEQVATFKSDLTDIEVRMGGVTKRWMKTQRLKETYK
jgi:hypothetical protein